MQMTLLKGHKNITVMRHRVVNVNRPGRLAFTDNPSTALKEYIHETAIINANNGLRHSQII